MYKILRDTAFTLLRPLPMRRRRAVDRWLRAGHDMGKLARADAAVISYPKSGRTWVRAFLSTYFQETLGLRTDDLLGFDNYHALDPRAPRILFNHDSYFDARLDDQALVDWLRPRRPVLLVRDPRDTVVSSYYQSQFRTAPQKRIIYERDRPELAQIDRFVVDPEAGLPWILNFYTRWARRRALLPEMPVIRYEELKTDATAEFGRLVRGIGLEPDPAAVAAAIEAARFERMKEKEQSGAFASEGSRFGNRDSGRPEAFKVRQGKVGGYRESLKPATVEWMERTIDEHMPPGFGYRADEQAAAARAYAGGGRPEKASKA